MKQIPQHAREQLIDQIDRSFATLAPWTNYATLYLLLQREPKIDPGTGKPIELLRDALAATSDKNLIMLRDGLAIDGKLLPVGQS